VDRPGRANDRASEGRRPGPRACHLRATVMSRSRPVPGARADVRGVRSLQHAAARARHGPKVPGHGEAASASCTSSDGCASWVHAGEVPDVGSIDARAPLGAHTPLARLLQAATASVAHASAPPPRETNALRPRRTRLIRRAISLLPSSNRWIGALRNAAPAGRDREAPQRRIARARFTDSTRSSSVPSPVTRPAQHRHARPGSSGTSPGPVKPVGS
jgi:hypothetical protein